MLLLLAAPGWAWGSERANLALELLRQGRAEAQCPDEGTFRALVAAKLGYDPFGGDTASRLRVTFRSAGSELRGSLSFESGGEAKRERTLRAADGDCFELATSLALSAAVAMDPDAVANRATGSEPAPQATESAPPPPESRPEPAPPPPRATPAPRASPRAEPAGLGLRFGAGVEVPVGLTPSVTAGARVAAGVGGDGWFVVLEGNATLPSSAHTPFGDVSAWLAGGALVPCVRPRLGANAALDLCAVGRFAALSSHAEDVTRSESQTDLVATLGPRVGLELLPWRSVGFVVDVEAPLSLSRVHLLINDEGVRQDAWASSRVGIVGGFSVVVRLP